MLMMIGDHGLHPFTAILWNTISFPNNKLSADFKLCDLAASVHEQGWWYIKLVRNAEYHFPLENLIDITMNYLVYNGFFNMNKKFCECMIDIFVRE